MGNVSDINNPSNWSQTADEVGLVRRTPLSTEDSGVVFVPYKKTSKLSSIVSGDEINGMIRIDENEQDKSQLGSEKSKEMKSKVLFQNILRVVNLHDSMKIKFEQLLLQFQEDPNYEDSEIDYFKDENFFMNVLKIVQEYLPSRKEIVRIHRGYGKPIVSYVRVYSTMKPRPFADFKIYGHSKMCFDELYERISERINYPKQLLKVFFRGTELKQNSNIFCENLHRKYILVKRLSAKEMIYDVLSFNLSSIGLSEISEAFDLTSHEKIIQYSFSIRDEHTFREPVDNKVGSDGLKVTKLPNNKSRKLNQQYKKKIYEKKKRDFNGIFDCLLELFRILDTSKPRYENVGKIMFNLLSQIPPSKSVVHQYETMECPLLWCLEESIMSNKFELLYHLRILCSPSRGYRKDPLWKEKFFECGGIKIILRVLLEDPDWDTSSEMTIHHIECFGRLLGLMIECFEICDSNSTFFGCSNQQDIEKLIKKVLKVMRSYKLAIDYVEEEEEEYEDDNNFEGKKEEEEEEEKKDIDEKMDALPRFDMKKENMEMLINNSNINNQQDLSSSSSSSSSHRFFYDFEIEEMCMVDWKKFTFFQIFKFFRHVINYSKSSSSYLIEHNSFSLFLWRAFQFSQVVPFERFILSSLCSLEKSNNNNNNNVISSVDDDEEEEEEGENNESSQQQQQQCVNSETRLFIRKIIGLSRFCGKSFVECATFVRLLHRIFWQARWISKRCFIQNHILLMLFNIITPKKQKLIEKRRKTSTDVDDDFLSSYFPKKLINVTIEAISFITRCCKIHGFFPDSYNEFAITNDPVIDNICPPLIPKKDLERIHSREIKPRFIDLVISSQKNPSSEKTVSKTLIHLCWNNIKSSKILGEQLTINFQLIKNHSLFLGAIIPLEDEESISEERIKSLMSSHLNYITKSVFLRSSQIKKRMMSEQEAIDRTKFISTLASNNFRVRKFVVVEGRARLMRICERWNWNLSLPSIEKYLKLSEKKKIKELFNGDDDDDDDSEEDDDKKKDQSSLTEEEKNARMSLYLNNMKMTFTCPITLQVMKDPVILIESNQTYERLAIETWLRSNNTDPLTRIILRSKKLQPNLNLRQAIEEWTKWKKDNKSRNKK